MLQEYQRGWGVGGGVVGSLSFDVQGRGHRVQFGPIRTDRKRGGVQKLDIFHGCHKCMVPNETTACSKYP